ncbi:MAG: hypothetical protein KDK99_20745 [Verrucomicrobiales bacterium]|nr:hypothetical protein [Verrucomicrobiales bacterium]
MKSLASTLLAAAALLIAQAPASLHAHCQVPCGIYGDELRFQAMLEDQSTIAKAGAEVAKLVAGESSALSANQIARWVVTKEEHAQKIQDTIAAYFMAQRIKADDPQYTAKLTAAHKVMTAAMKAKQDPSGEVAEALKTAILDFYRAYEGKEPSFE